MKYFYSHPEKDSQKAFFNDYQDITKFLLVIIILCQLVSFATEFAAAYLLFSPTINTYLGHIVNATFAATSVALLLAVAVELVIFFGLPTAIDSLLHWKTRKRYAEALMKISVIIICFIGLASGMTLSYFGSRMGFSQWGQDRKAIAEAETKKQKADSTAAAEFQADTARVLQAYRQDSAAAVAGFLAEAKALDRQAKAERVRDWKDKERSHSEIWTATEAEAEAKRGQAKAAISGLVSSKNEKLAGLNSTYKTAMAEAENEYQSAINAEKAGRNQKGAGLAWVTIALQLLVIFLQTVRRNYLRGAGIRKTFQPGAYYFDMKNWAYTLHSLQNRARNWVRTKVELKVNLPTLPYPEPESLESLIDWGGVEDKRAKPETITNAAGKGVKSVKKQEIIRHVGRAESKQGQAKARAKLSAERVISAYLETDDPVAVKNFYEKVAAFLNGSSTENPFHPKNIGFFTVDPAEIARGAGNTPQNQTPPDSDRGKNGQKNCDNCGAAFTPRTTHQRFCQTKCRNEFHAAKNGGTPYNPFFRHPNKEEQ